MIADHAALVRDFNPLHLDKDFAVTTSFGAPIIHGSLMLNLLTEAVERCQPQLIAKGRIAVRFVAPALVGDTITAGGCAVQGRTDTLDVWVSRGDDTRVVVGTLTMERSDQNEEE